MSSLTSHFFPLNYPLLHTTCGFLQTKRPQSTGGRALKMKCTCVWPDLLNKWQLSQKIRNKVLQRGYFLAVVTLSLIVKTTAPPGGRIKNVTEQTALLFFSTMTSQNICFPFITKNKFSVCSSKSGLIIHNKTSSTLRV